MTSKKQSLRSRLRDDAARELDLLVDNGRKVLKIAGNAGGLTAIELAKMIGSNQTDTLQATLISKLADRKEAALEKIYNEQQEPKK